MADLSTSRWVVVPQMADCRFAFAAENTGSLPWMWVLATEQAPSPWGQASFRWTAHVRAWWAWRQYERGRRLHRVCAARIEEADRG